MPRRKQRNTPATHTNGSAASNNDTNGAANDEVVDGAQHANGSNGAGNDEPYLGDPESTVNIWRDEAIVMLKSKNKKV